MKANVSKPLKNEKSEKGNGNAHIVLSIGLIVKNEEKYIDRCLSALEPIRDALPTEIVVVDTGSIDKTVEIAKKHTDKVYFFEWIDDFSAARNYGLERCSGEWFMFLDADEIFDEDVSAFLDFFKSGKKDEYSTACIHLKNYQDEDYEIYNESIPTRLAKRTDELRFINKVHECFSFSEDGTTYDIKTYAHHYGYVGTKTNGKKAERNRKILESELERNPDSAAAVSYLYYTVDDYKEKERYIKKWLELIDRNVQNAMPEYCYSTCVQFYFKENKYAEAVKYAEEYFKLPDVETEISSLTVLIFAADACYSLDEYEDAIGYLERYFDLYERYLKGELSYRVKTMLMGIQSYEAEQQKYILADCYRRLGNRDKAYEALKKASLTDVLSGSVAQCADILVAILTEKRDVRGLVDAFKVINGIDADQACAFAAECYWKLRKVGDTAESSAKSGAESSADGSGSAGGEAEALALLRAFMDGASKAEPQSFGGIMCEVLMNKGKPGFDGLVQAFIDMIPKFSRAYSPVIAAGIKSGCTMQKLLTGASRIEISDMCKKLFVELGKDKYTELVVPFVNAYEIETLKELFFALELLDLIRNEDPEIYYNFAMLFANYVTNVYSEEVLNDTDVNILPPSDAFGYYVYKADAAKNAGDKLGFVRALRQALEICPDFKDTVSMLTESLNENE